MNATTAFAALAAVASAPALAGFVDGTRINARFFRDVDNFQYDNQTFTVGPGIEGVLDLSNAFPIANVAIGYKSIELTFTRQPSFAVASGVAATARHIIRFSDIDNAVRPIESATVSITAGSPPVNWGNAAAFRFTENTIDLPLNSVSNITSVNAGTVIRIDVTFIPAPGALALLAPLAAARRTRRRR